MNSDSRRRQIRYFPDYGAGPLWESFTEKYAMEPSDYALSASLASDLHAWFEFWEIHFHFDAGWDTEANRDLSKAQVRELISRLRVEVADFADVIDETDWLSDK